MKRVLIFCFADEFHPFQLQEQVKTENQKRRRDFIIDNRASTTEFWNKINITRHVEKILFDAKNYSKPIQYNEMTGTLRYLRNKSFGNLLIILSRKGTKDLTEFIEEYSDNGTVVILLNDDDIIKMIQLKNQGHSASDVIADKYFHFLSLK